MHSSAYPTGPNRFMSVVALFALFAMLVGVAPQPARADKASTTAVILGAAAAAAAILISNNVRHKQAQANTTVGRTQDGGRILGDGRVVYPNGDVLYTGNGNGQTCTYDGYGVPCGDRTQVYYPQGYNGRHHDRHHENDDEDNDGEHGQHGQHGQHGEHGNHGDNGGD